MFKRDMLRECSKEICKENVQMEFVKGMFKSNMLRGCSKGIMLRECSKLIC